MSPSVSFARHRPALAGPTLALIVLLASGTGALAQGASVVVDPVGPLPEGANTLLVTGQGFATAGNGIYVVFGPITPAPGYYMDPGLYGAFKWVSPGGPETPATAPLAADGSFATTLAITSVMTTPNGEVDCATTACAVITFAAHGSPDRSQDTCTAVSFIAGGTDAASPVASPLVARRGPPHSPRTPTRLPPRSPRRTTVCAHRSDRALTRVGSFSAHEKTPPNGVFCTVPANRTEVRSSATPQGHLSRRLHRLP